MLYSFSSLKLCITIFPLSHFSFKYITILTPGDLHMDLQNTVQLEPIRNRWKSGLVASDQVIKNNIL